MLKPKENESRSGPRRSYTEGVGQPRSDYDGYNIYMMASILNYISAVYMYYAITESIVFGVLFGLTLNTMLVIVGDALLKASRSS